MFSKGASSHERLIEEKVYEEVANEIARGVRREGLWLKAVANSNGSEEKAKSFYIQYRVQALLDDLHILNKTAKEFQHRDNVEKSNLANQLAFISEAKKAKVTGSVGTMRYWYENEYKGSFKLDDIDIPKLLELARTQ